ncbi:MAG: RNA polymerase sigma factor [Deltaproteobacteria bacterium]|nr:RNA polymerase sigma factor [Deltaproteobacteria bacterium]
MMRHKIAYLHRSEVDDAASDSVLVAACGDGDATALGTLFDRYHVAVYRFLSSMSGTDGPDLDDLVQTTFIQVGRSAHRFAGRSSLRSWIFGIGANVARHHIRSEVRRRLATNALEALQVHNNDSLQASVERREQIKLLAEALPRLSHKLRVVFVMCDLEGISGIEAANTLGIKQGTLWRRLHDARKKLGQAIERRHVR